MLAYFVRRLIGGLVSAFGVSLLLYAFMVYGPFGLNDEYYLLTHLADKPVDIYGAYRLVDSYHIEKSWPLNYGQWLLNLDNKDGVLGTGFVDTPQRNDCTVGGRIYHKGILAGDWDSSWRVCPSAPVLDMYGIDLPAFFTLALTPIFILMLVTCLQRIGKHPLRGYSPKQARQLYSMQPIRLLG